MEKNQKSREAVMVEAADWLARLDAHEDDTSLRNAFEAWRAESPTHAVAIARLRATWEATGRVRFASRIQTAKNDNRAKPSQWVSGGIAAAAIFVLSIGVYSISPSTSYATAVGESRIVDLGQGVQVLLNTDSSIKVVKRWLRTKVVVVKGEVVLTVSKADRPTTLAIAGRTINSNEAVTDVRLGNGSAELAVLSGSIDVSRPAGQPLEAEQGDLVAITGNPADVTVRHEPEEIDRRMSWRQGRLRFDGQTLGEVASEFNRYNQTKIIVAPEFSGLRIGGAFDLNKPQAFAETTSKSLDVPMRKTTEGLKFGR
jgi:transmembrane sensor